MQNVILKLNHIVAGYDGSDVLKGVYIDIEPEFDHLHCRPERCGKIHSSAHDQRLVETA